MNCLFSQLKTIMVSDTLAVRFWFGLASFGFAIKTMYSNTESTGAVMQALAPSWLWTAFFLVHALALIYGALTHRYNKLLLILEGILGTTLWSAVTASHVVAHGTLDATLAGALIAWWLLIRYPTHWEYTDARR